MADSKITALTELTTPASGDVLAIVDDPSGTPTTKKVEIDSLDDYFSASTKTLTNKTLTSPVYQGLIDGWVSANETWTYASATTFTISGDLTAKYQKGDKIKFTQATDGVKYMYIVGVSESGGTTTITVTGGSDYDLDNEAITANYYSKVENPQGFPQWFNWTPSYSAEAGTFASVTTTVAKFKISKDLCVLIIFCNGTTNDTPLFLEATYPFGTSASDWWGSAMTRDGTRYSGIYSTTTGGGIRIYKYDFTDFASGAGRGFGINAYYQYTI